MDLISILVKTKHLKHYEVIKVICDLDTGKFIFYGIIANYFRSDNSLMIVPHLSMAA